MNKFLDLYVLLFVFTSVVLITTAPTASAVPDNIYMTVQNNSNCSYVNLLLPDDAGWNGKGDIEFTVNMQPGSIQTWSDLTQQTSRKINENNSWTLPICFRQRTNASCGDRFTLTINSSRGASRVITGGVCLSNYAGVSTAPASPTQSIISAINNNFGAFDVAFSEQGYYAQPGDTMNVTVFAETAQDTNLHIEFSGGQTTTPAQDVSLSAGVTRQVSFSLIAPSSSGNYDLILRGSIPGCTAQACSITKHAVLTVSNTPPVQGGFSLSLFPTTIDTQLNNPVSYRLTIHNNEITRNFSITMPAKPYGIDTNFNAQNVQVPAGHDGSVEFTVIPTGTLTSYEFVIYAAAETTKFISGYLNVNGMAAGAQRGLESVQQTGNQSAINQANSAYNNYQSNPTLQNYGNLQDQLARLSQGQNTSRNVTNGTVPIVPHPTPPVNPTPSGLDLFGKDMWIIIVVVGILLVVCVLFFMKKGSGSKGKGLKKEFEFKEPILDE